MISRTNYSYKVDVMARDCGLDDRSIPTDPGIATIVTGQLKELKEVLSQHHRKVAHSQIKSLSKMADQKIHLLDNKINQVSDALLKTRLKDQKKELENLFSLTRVVQGDVKLDIQHQFLRMVADCGLENASISDAEIVTITTLQVQGLIDFIFLHNSILPLADLSKLAELSIKKIGDEERLMQHLPKGELKQKLSEQVQHLKKLTQMIEEIEFRQFDQKMENLILRKETPFDDLVVFADHYPGVLPTNGILQKDLIQAEKIFQSLNTLASPFVVNGTGQYKKEIQSLFKTLLAIRPSRNLIIEIVNLLKQTANKITIKEANSSYFQNSFPSGGPKIKLFGIEFDASKPQLEVGLATEEKVLMITKTPQGKNNLIYEPKSIRLATALAHELIHACHFLKGDNLGGVKEHLISPDYSDLEEQTTICGWGEKRPLMPNLSELAKKKEYQKDLTLTQAELNAEFDETKAQPVFYEPINENVIRAALGAEHRINHQGITKPKNLKHSVNFTLSQIKNYLKRLEKFKLDDEIQELIAANPKLVLNKA